jgi:phage tail-like protein
MAHRKSTFNIVLEIGGANVAGFTEVSGLTSDGNVIEYREGEGDGALRKLQALRKFGQITLKRGYTDSHDLWKWGQSAKTGEAHRKSGLIVLLNEARVPVLRWSIKDAWIKKWEGPAMNAETNEVAIERWRSSARASPYVDHGCAEANRLANHDEDKGGITPTPPSGRCNGHKCLRPSPCRNRRSAPPVPAVWRPRASP